MRAFACSLALIAVASALPAEPLRVVVEGGVRVKMRDGRVQGIERK